MASLKLPVDAARRADDDCTAQSPTEAFFNPSEVALLSPESAYFEGQTSFFNSLPQPQQVLMPQPQVLMPANAQVTAGATFAGFSQANVPWTVPAGMTTPACPTLLNSTMRMSQQSAEQKVPKKPQPVQQVSPAPGRQGQQKKQDRAPCPTAVFVDLSSLKEKRK